ncbi:hypothetical protein ACFOWM_05590 [Ferruginibacter yonginensis]|uniref:Uncharacterized protein n=1 Tax=Ferruginibacter yonginensis TaxID=1310416 RepID=A0ABV8QR70_9BACT
MITTPKKNCWCQLLKDKDGCYSLREIAIAVMLIAMITAWLATQFFQKSIPEFMFYSFASLIGAGCFGYSIERKTNSSNSTES